MAIDHTLAEIQHYSTYNDGWSGPESTAFHPEVIKGAERSALWLASFCQDVSARPLVNGKMAIDATFNCGARISIIIDEEYASLKHVPGSI